MFLPKYQEYDSHSIVSNKDDDRHSSEKRFGRAV